MTLAIASCKRYMQAAASRESLIEVRVKLFKQPLTLLAVTKSPNGLLGLDVALTNVDGVPVVGCTPILYYFLCVWNKF
jgi:hypothetical protein